MSWDVIKRRSSRLDASSMSYADYVCPVSLERLHVKCVQVDMPQNLGFVSNLRGMWYCYIGVGLLTVGTRDSGVYTT